MDAYSHIPTSDWIAIDPDTLNELSEWIYQYRRYNFPDGSGYETLEGQLFAVDKRHRLKGGVEGKIYAHREALYAMKKPEQ